MSENATVTKSAPSLVGLLEKMGPELARALPAHCSPERMARIALTALRMTPKLVECSPASFLGSVMSCAQLGLEPNTPLGHAYLIPRKIKGRMTCTLLIGYQGMLDLADRSGRLEGVQAHVVHEGDTFSWTLGLTTTLTHVPSRDAARKSKPITHVYAVAQRVDGPALFRVLTLAEVHDRKARGGGGGGTSPWSTDFEAMACKTAVRALWPWLPKSPEMARAAAIDTATETGAPGSAGWDPAVTDVLAQHDIVDDEPVDAEAEVRDIPRGGTDRLASALQATAAREPDEDDEDDVPLRSLDEVAEEAAAELDAKNGGAA